MVLLIELPETLHMAGSKCGERIKLGFIDLDTEIDKYHTSVV